MAEERLDVDWLATASLLAMTANVNRDSKKRPQPFGIEDFHPWRRQGGGKISPMQGSIKDLKVMLRGGRKKKK